MTEMGNEVVINLPAILAQLAYKMGDDGVLREDARWNEEGAETLYILAEFLFAKDLLDTGVSVERNPNLVIKRLHITETGKRFLDAHLWKWECSIKFGWTETKKVRSLENRWNKFIAMEPQCTSQ
jgi:hypothetical protein